MPKNDSQSSHESPEDMIFVANLDEFASRVSLICGLEAGGKITPVEAYTRIRTLWKQLKKSKKHLNPGGESKLDRGI